MRSAKEQEWFPYDSKTTCYILIQNNNITQIQHTLYDLKSAYQAVLEGSATLYAVWPGQYRSDLFIVDDLDAFADAVGIPRKSNHIHDIEWKISEYGNNNSRYAYVDCKFKCNCSFFKMGIKKFANDMREQRGWNVATSKGYGGNGEQFSLYVSRSSLK